MQTCPDCGCRVYRLGCVNCNEDAYIAQQAAEDQDWPSPSVDAVDPQASSTGMPSPRVSGSDSLLSRETEGTK